jgi:NAD(P)-dependent dehydrogenase (short-subunit alcohol dehydrogenase family)
MKNKIVLVSGANSGIGKSTALALAKQGAQVILQCRSEERGEAARKEIIEASGNDNIDLMLCDLASHDSIRQFAKEFRDAYGHIDVLVNNAGAIFGKKIMSPDSREYTLGLNHMGYFLNTHYLIDLVLAGEMKRVVNVSSLAHKFVAKIDWDNLEGEKTFGQFYQYGLSKLFNIYFTTELSKRYASEGLISNCLHPGVVNTGFGNSGSGFFKSLIDMGRRFLTPADKGSETSVFLASAPEAANFNGQYFANRKPAKLSKLAKDQEIAAKVWDKSLEWAGIAEFGKP